MKTIKILCITVSIMVLSNFTFAQKAWTLEECINYAIENNISVKRQELNATSAKKNLTQSKLELLPNLNSTGQHYYNSGKTLDQDTYQYVKDDFKGGNINISSEITIFQGLQNFNAIQQNKIDLLSQLQNVEKVKNDITINISTAYLQILLNKELRDNAEQQLNITQEQIKKTTKLVEIGNAAKGDLLQIKAQAASEKAALTNYENNLNIAYLDLTQLLNLTDSENFEIAFPNIPNLTIEGDISQVKDVFENALTFLPEIKSAELNVKSSKKGLAIAKGALSPSLAFGFNYSSRYNNLVINKSYKDQISFNGSKVIFVGINVPIFNNWRTMHGISQAKINLSDSKLNLDLQKQNLYKGIQQARALATAALEKYKANLDAVESNSEAFRYTEQKYEVGLVDILEYKTAKNSLNKAKSDLAQAKYEFIFRTKILDFYKGEQITL